MGTALFGPGKGVLCTWTPAHAWQSSDAYPAYRFTDLTPPGN